MSAKTIKNKVAPPFRTVNFEIHFGKGIMEHEQVFDELRKAGAATVGDNKIELAGTGAWKTLMVHNQKTGEVLAEKKFYKSDFGEVWSNPEFTSYVDDLLEATMVRKMSNPEEVDIDPESYEEVRAISLDNEAFMELDT